MILTRRARILTLALVAVLLVISVSEQLKDRSVARYADIILRSSDRVFLVPEGESAGRACLTLERYLHDLPIDETGLGGHEAVHAAIGWKRVRHGFFTGGQLCASGMIGRVLSSGPDLQPSLAR